MTTLKSDLSAEEMAFTLAPRDELEGKFRSGLDLTADDKMIGNTRHLRCIYTALGLMQLVKPEDVDLETVPVAYMLTDALKSGKATSQFKASEAMMIDLEENPAKGPEDPGRHGSWNKMLLYSVLILRSSSPHMAAKYLREVASYASKMIGAALSPPRPHGLEFISSVFSASLQVKGK